MFKKRWLLQRVPVYTPGSPEMLAEASGELTAFNCQEWEPIGLTINGFVVMRRPMTWKERLVERWTKVTTVQASSPAQPQSQPQSRMERQPPSDLLEIHRELDRAARVSSGKR
jgi:hypothetical protein